MSYDVAVWEGATPSAADAPAVFDELMDRAEEEPTPPTPAIRAYVDALLLRHPDGESQPWAVSSIIEDASGPLVYLTMTVDGAERAIPDVVSLARERGLVCNDPQVEELLDDAGPGMPAEDEDVDLASCSPRAGSR